MEAELTEMDSIPDYLAVSEDESADEAVPIHIRNKEIKNHTKRQCAKLLKH